MFSINLTSNEASTLRNSLIVAAERFDEHAEDFRKTDPVAWRSIIEQFEWQARDARTLVEKLDLAEYGED